MLCPRLYLQVIVETVQRGSPYRLVLAKTKAAWEEQQAEGQRLCSPAARLDTLLPTAAAGAVPRGASALGAAVPAVAAEPPQAAARSPPKATERERQKKKRPRHEEAAAAVVINLT